MCADLAGAGVDAATGAITLPTPLQNGLPYCSPDCAVLYEQFYAACHPRLEIFAPNAPIVPFLRLCQGLVPNWTGGNNHPDPPLGGAHRRLEAGAGAAEPDL